MFRKLLTATATILPLGAAPVLAQQDTAPQVTVEEEPNRTKAAQQLPGVGRNGAEVEKTRPGLQIEDVDRDTSQTAGEDGTQTTARPETATTGDMETVKREAVTTMAEWEARITQNPDLFERDQALQEAWAETQQAHEELQQAVPEEWDRISRSYRESLQTLQEAWNEAQG